MTFPTNVVSTRAGSAPADASAALDETTASSVALPSKTDKNTTADSRKREAETKGRTSYSRQARRFCCWFQRSECSECDIYTADTTSGQEVRRLPIQIPKSSSDRDRSTKVRGKRDTKPRTNNRVVVT